MPLSSGMSIHDDTKHKGSAKRDTANGVAPLDASGNVEDEAGNDCETTNNKGAVSGYAGLDASARLGDVLLPGIFKLYTISDDILHSNDSEKSTNSISDVELKKTDVYYMHPNPSTIRISFEMRTENASYSAHGRIFKVGSPFGTDRVTNSTSYVTFTEDLSWSQYTAMTLEVRSGNAASHAYVRNFRVYGLKSQQTLAGAIVSDDVGVVDPFTAVAVS